MNALTVTDIPPSTALELKTLESYIKDVAELPDPKGLKTEHFLYAGLYSRTLFMPKDTVIIGALIKIPTVVTVSGHCFMTTGLKNVELKGYHVFKGSAGRRQGFIAVEDTYITMSFATAAKTVEEAEEEFTAEFNQLITRR
ncbi:hypothetical protein [Succinatimonas hippei]|uniref:hypothetical protein n=1 Tax=Succinatimonas hippei TaxID=626938 RepID=UPI002493891F|nr:hypothetical protein [Succinatimonas hippei]